MNLRNVRAFTLSELLAVIAIIASLAALLFPAFAGAKKSAKTSVCIGVEHQLGLATSLYMADADDLYPRVVNAFERIVPDFRMGRAKTDDPKAFPTIAEALESYTKGKDVYRCPSDMGWHFEDLQAYPRFSMFNGNVSYLVAELLSNQSPSIWPDPSAAVFACDANPEWHTADYRSMDQSTWKTVRLFYDWHAAYRHGNGVDFGQGS